jgi:hypothetical protein
MKFQDFVLLGYDATSLANEVKGQHVLDLLTFDIRIQKANGAASYPRRTEFSTTSSRNLKIHIFVYSPKTVKPHLQCT